MNIYYFVFETSELKNTILCHSYCKRCIHDIDALYLTVHKQLNCVFWFQNPLKDLVRPLYFSRADPVRSPDSLLLYICVLCLSLSLYLSSRSLLYKVWLLGNKLLFYVANLYCWDLYFLFELFGENAGLFMLQKYFWWIYVLLEWFGGNVGVLLLQNNLVGEFILLFEWFDVLSHKWMSFCFVSRLNRRLLCGKQPIHFPPLKFINVCL